VNIRLIEWLWDNDCRARNISFVCAFSDGTRILSAYIKDYRMGKFDMKKIFSIILLVLSSMFLVSACGGNDMPSTPQQSPDVTPDDIIDAAPPPTAEPLPPGDESTITVLYNRISWWDNMDSTSKVQSVEELQAFYEDLKAADMNELDEDLVWRFTDGKYDANFFASHFLVMITVAENSGSNRHELTSLEEDNGVLTIKIDRMLPAVGTMDMAGWLIIIELSNNYSINDTNVVFTDVQSEE